MYYLLPNVDVKAFLQIWQPTCLCTEGLCHWPKWYLHSHSGHVLGTLTNPWLPFHRVPEAGPLPETSLVCRSSPSSLAPAPFVPASSLSGEPGCLTAGGRTALKRQLKQLLTSCANILSLTLWYSSSLSSIDLLRLSSLNGCILFCWTEKRNQEGYPSWAVRSLRLSNCQLRGINVHLNKWGMKSLTPSVPEEAVVGGICVLRVHDMQYQDMIATPGCLLAGCK